MAEENEEGEQRENDRLGIDIALAQLYAQKFLSYIIILISVLVIQIGIINQILPQRIIDFNGTVYQAKEVMPLPLFQICILILSLIVIIFLGLLVFRTSIEMCALEGENIFPFIRDIVVEWCKNHPFMCWYSGYKNNNKNDNILFGEKRIINILLLFGLFTLVSIDIPIVFFVILQSLMDVSQYVRLLYMPSIVLFLIFCIPGIGKIIKNRKNVSKP